MEPTYPLTLLKMIFLFFRKEFVSSLEGRRIDWFREILSTQLSFGDSFVAQVFIIPFWFPSTRFLFTNGMTAENRSIVRWYSGTGTPKSLYIWPKAWSIWKNCTNKNKKKHQCPSLPGLKCWQICVTRKHWIDIRLLILYKLFTFFGGGTRWRDVVFVAPFSFNT